VRARIGREGGLIGSFFSKDEEGKSESRKVSQNAGGKWGPNIVREKANIVRDKCLWLSVIRISISCKIVLYGIAWFKGHFLENRFISLNCALNWPAYGPNCNRLDSKLEVQSNPLPRIDEQPKPITLRKIFKKWIKSIIENFFVKTRHVLSKSGDWLEQMIHPKSNCC
jgi:hypothetical protein